MEKERLEATEAERSINEFSRKKEMLLEHRENLLKQIEETRDAIQKKRERFFSASSALIQQTDPMRDVPWQLKHQGMAPNWRSGKNTWL